MKRLLIFFAATILLAACDCYPDVKKFHWEPYNPETKPVVVFNDKTVTVHEGDAFFEDMKNLKRETWVYRKQWGK